MQLDSVYGADKGQVETALMDIAHEGELVVAVDKLIKIVRLFGSRIDAGRPNLIVGGFVCHRGFHGPILSLERGRLK